MTPLEYTHFTKHTAVYPVDDAIVYPLLGLCGEVGELAQMAKREMRDGKPLDLHAVGLELGDCLWYLTRIADESGFTLQDIIDMNREKLTGRAARGTIRGHGDER